MTDLGEVLYVAIGLVLFIVVGLCLTWAALIWLPMKTALVLIALGLLGVGVFVYRLWTSE